MKRLINAVSLLLWIILGFSCREKQIQSKPIVKEEEDQGSFAEQRPDIFKYDTLLHWNINGGLSDVEMVSKNIVARRWGIRYLSCGGCCKSQADSDRIDSMNQITFDSLDIRFGKNWEKRYYRELAKERKHLDRVYNQVMESSHILSDIEKGRFESYEININMVPLDKPYTYLVYVEKGDKWADSVECFYKFKANARTGELMLLSNRVEKMAAIIVNAGDMRSAKL